MLFVQLSSMSSTCSWPARSTGGETNVAQCSFCCLYGSSTTGAGARLLSPLLILTLEGCDQSNDSSDTEIASLISTTSPQVVVDKGELAFRRFCRSRMAWFWNVFAHDCVERGMQHTCPKVGVIFAMGVVAHYHPMVLATGIITHCDHT